MKKLVTILSATLCLALSLAFIGCSDSSSESSVGGGYRPSGPTCEHSFRVDREPTWTDGGQVICNKCEFGYEVPELSKEWLYSKTNLPNESVRYSYNHEVAGLITF